MLVIISSLTKEKIDKSKRTVGSSASCGCVVCDLSALRDRH